MITRVMRVIRNPRKFLVASVGWVVVLATLCVVPHRWCGREADAWFRGERELHERLARGVERWVREDLDQDDFATGDDRFNGEWLFATYMMAGMGFGQTAQEHPDLLEPHVELMSLCIDRLLTPKAASFDTAAWNDSALQSLDGGDHHGAYLGYMNLLLSYHRLLDPQSEHAELNDRVTATLLRRLEASPTMLLQTYPGETYPVDNSAAIGSIGLHAQATGADHGEFLKAWAARCRSDYIDAGSGLLYQAVDSFEGTPRDHPRGSGTGLAVYFLSFADRDLSRELFAAMQEELSGGVLGFGAMREYPSHVRGGWGDVDSGPVLLGYSVSATGFAFAGCRMYGDADRFRSMYSTAYLFGAPVDVDDRRTHLTGGPIGDALLFALWTAQPAKGKE